MFEKIMIRLVLIAFFFISVGPLPPTEAFASAQNMIGLPAPGTMVDFSPKFNQATLKGIVFYPQNPFKFDFILDEGDVYLNKEESKAQSRKIAAYFLASLTTPEKEIWVNLSPYEKARIIPVSFGKTLMGQNLLAQDYMLKQIMATALYPERQLGREFWQKVYKQAQERFGTTNIAINTFNKVWIVPDRAVVYENAKMNAVFVAESSLKVMLEKDYLAAQTYGRLPGDTFRSRCPQARCQASQPLNTKAIQVNNLSQNIIRQIVIPALEKEVNEGKNFAPLRQVYNALILAKWYKDNLRNNVIAKGYVDRNKIAGVDSHDKQRVSKIYGQYLKAYKKGVFNFIREDFDETSQSIVPRKYFSGGFMGAVNVTKTDRAMTASGFSRALIARVLLTLAAVPSAYAQTHQLPNPRAAIGNTTAPAVNLTPGQKESLLTTIEEASNGGGDPVAAAKALRQMPYDQRAVEYAASILRLSPGGSVDKALGNLLSNSIAAPLLTLPGGVSGQVGVTNLGVAQSFGEIINTIREKKNVGTSTLRLEAALYLARVADQLEATGVLVQLFSRDPLELDIENEPSDTDKAARLLTEAVLIKAGVASREVGGNAIKGLDQVEKALSSNNWIVRYSALAVFEAIPQGDPDNRYQGIIERSLKEMTDPVMLEMMANIALTHGMTTAFPNIMQDLEKVSKLRPSSSDIVALINWHALMQAAMLLAIKLSNGDLGSIAANLDAMSDQSTAPGATDTINSIGQGFRFLLVQSGNMSLEDFVEQLNNLRTQNGLGQVTVSDIRILPQDRNIGDYLAQLKNGINPDDSAYSIISEGGPMYFPDLLGIIQGTNNPGTVKAIISHLDEILAMGVYPNDNPWTLAINAKLTDVNNRAAAVAVMYGLAASGVQTKDYVQAVIQFVFTQKNPAFNPTETGETGQFNKSLALAAKVLVDSQADDQELDSQIDANTPSDQTGILTNRLLKQYIRIIRKGTRWRAELEQMPMLMYANYVVPAQSGLWNDGSNGLLIRVATEPRTYQLPSGLVSQGSGLGFQTAEKAFLDYVHGVSGTPSGAAGALESANQTYKSPADPNSGYSIIERYASSPESHNPDAMIRMVKVFSALRDRNLSYVMMNQILGAYLFWFDQRNRGNPDSLNLVAGMEKLLKGLGKNALRAAVQNRLSTATDQERQALLDLVPDAGSPLAGDPYTMSLSAIFNPNVGGQPLIDALNRIAGMKDLPPTALHDLIPALDLSKFGSDWEYKGPLIDAIAQANSQLGGGIVDDVAYQPIWDRYLKKFQEAPSLETQTIALKLIMSAPPEIAGDKLGKAISSLKTMYPNFAGDDQQRQDYFDLLTTMRDFVKNLKTTDFDRYSAMVGHIKRDLQDKIRVKRFEEGVGLQYVFLASIDQHLVDGIVFGIRYRQDWHFLDVPDQPWVSLSTGGVSIPAVKAVLAGRLGKINGQIRRVPPADLLVELESLFTSSNSVSTSTSNSTDQIPKSQISKEQISREQMAAMYHLGWVTLLFQNEIPLDTDSRTYLLDLGNQFEVLGGKGEMMVQDTKSFSDQDWILYMGQLTKRGEYGWDLARQNLQSEDLVTHHPEAINEILYQIGEWGGPEMVEPLLRFYIKQWNLTTYGFLGFSNDSVLGASAEEAIRKIGRHHKAEVVSTIQTFMDSLPAGIERTMMRRVFLGTYVSPGVVDEISRDKAMTTNGGIDLGNVNVRSQGTRGIKTAFNDQAQLSILIQSDGLIPYIENVEPLGKFAIDQLLGTI